MQVHTPDPLLLMHYACSDRVIAVPTFLINARRYAVMRTTGALRDMQQQQQQEQQQQKAKSSYFTGYCA